MAELKTKQHDADVLNLLIILQILSKKERTVLNL